MREKKIEKKLTCFAKPIKKIYEKSKNVINFINTNIRSLWALEIWTKLSAKKTVSCT